MWKVIGDLKDLTCREILENVVEIWGDYSETETKVRRAVRVLKREG